MPEEIEDSSISYFDGNDVEVEIGHSNGLKSRHQYSTETIQHINSGPQQQDAYDPFQFDGENGEEEIDIF